MAQRTVADAFGDEVTGWGAVGAAVAIAAGAVGGWKVVRDRQREPLAVAVLGEIGVGKTTLLALWSGDPVEDPPATTASEPYRPIKVDLKDGRRFIILAGHDVAGTLNAYSEWNEEVAGVRCVVYLVDARRLAFEAGHRSLEVPPHLRQPDRVLRDVRLIDSMLAEPRPRNWRCVIAVTHRDEDPRYSAHSGEKKYDHLVFEQLEEAVIALGGHRRVKVTSGSLVPQELGNELKDQIIQLLRPQLVPRSLPGLL